MNEAIKNRIEQVRCGEVPEGYQRYKTLLYPCDWKGIITLDSVLKERTERNKSGVFSKNDVLSVSGDFGIINQIDFFGRSYAGLSVSEYHVVRTGDIVYTKSPLLQNPYGIIKLNKGAEGIVSTLYAVYSCSHPTTGQYLDYYFSITVFVNNYLKPLVKKGAKNDMKINNEYVLSGFITLPPIIEQQKIVETLTCCDQVISLKKQLLDEKRRQKKWLVQKLLDPDSECRVQGFENSAWKTFRLGDLGTFSKGTGISNEDCVSGELPCIKYGDIYTSYDVCFGDAVSHTETEIASDSPHVEGGCLLFTGSGEDRLEIGKCTAYMGSTSLAVGGDIIIMKPNAQKANPLFLAYTQFTDALIRQKARVSQGYSIVHLYADDIRKLVVDIPLKLEEQEAIVEILSAADREIDLLEQELTQWQQKKKALMQLLLTGIVRVNV